jgi:hypothetical protein
MSEINSEKLTRRERRRAKHYLSSVIGSVFCMDVQ